MNEISPDRFDYKNVMVATTASGLDEAVRNPPGENLSLFARFRRASHKASGGRLSLGIHAVIFLMVVLALQAADSPYAIKNDAAFFDMLDLQRPGLEAVRKAVEAANWAAARQAWARHLETRKEPKWMWSHRDKGDIKAYYDKEFGGMAGAIAGADKVLAHEFAFGGVKKKLEPKIEWYQGNIEWTHVLSRFAYWNDLGQAYWATGKPAYAKEFVNELEQWVAANPVPADLSQMHQHGSRWRTLEAGIRGLGWFHAMELFMDAPEFGADAKFLMTKSLSEHGRYLYAKAHDKGYGIGNWQVCECSGLVAIGIMLPELKESAAWRAAGLKLLAEHMEKDVLPDGVHWELTPGYHTWVMHEFLEVGQLCKLNGIEAPGLLNRHEKMFDFLLGFSKPDGRYPPVGDAGLGRDSIASSMGLGALIYNRPDMRALGNDKPEKSWIWMLGLDRVRKYADIPRTPPKLGSVLFPNAQYAVMRGGWKRDDRYLLFDAAPWHGGHSHADALQVVAYAGRDLLVDPGMCSYDQHESVGFRKTALHNVVMVDGVEQSRTSPNLLAWDSKPEADFAAAELVEKNWRHQRSVLFVKPNYWVVMDYVLGNGPAAPGPHEVTRFFHFPVDSKAVGEGKQAQTAFGRGINIRVLALDDSKLEMRQMMVPTGAATFAQAPVAAYTVKGGLPLICCTVLIPYGNPKELPTVESVPATHPLVRMISLKFPNGQRDEMAFAPEVRHLSLSGKEGQGRAFLVRSGPDADIAISLGNATLTAEKK